MAVNACLTAMIKSKQFDKALEFIKSKPNKSMDFSVQQAYILHRQGKNEEAAKLFGKINSDDTGVQHLKA